MKTIVAVLMMLFTGQFAFSQPGSCTANERQRHKEKRMEYNERRKDHREKMMQKLNLNADQRSKLAALRNEIKERRHAIKKDQTLSRVQKKEELRTLKNEKRIRFASMLNKDQKEKLTEMREKRGEKKGRKKAFKEKNLPAESLSI